MAPLRGRLLTRLHIDVDTSVCPIFGDGIEGAEPGHNPQYHGRNSYHPLLARIAESGTLLGAQLRPGKATLGGGDVAQLDRWLTALDAFLDDSPCLVTVRIDKGGDCAALFKVIAKHRRRFLVKERRTPDLVGEIVTTAKWATTEYDADGTVITQVAEIDFVRGEWREQGLPPIRVVAVRSRERQGGKHLDDSELTVQAFFTNDCDSEAEDVVLEYDGRAGIEPLLAELKQQWGLEKVSSHDFGANAALQFVWSSMVVELGEAHEQAKKATFFCIILPSVLGEGLAKTVDHYHCNAGFLYDLAKDEIAALPKCADMSSDAPPTYQDALKACDAISFALEFDLVRASFDSVDHDPKFVPYPCP